MFTGIVSERARVASSDGGRLVVETAIRAEIGDSVAIDGVCLTVTGARDGQLAFDVMVETLRRFVRATPSAATTSRDTSTRRAQFGRSSPRAKGRSSGSTRRRVSSATS